MQKTALLALIGATQSKHLTHRNKLQVLDSAYSTYNSYTSDDQSFHSSYTFWWSSSDAPTEEENIQYEQQCEIAPEDILDTSVFMRNTYYAIWNGLVKGFYKLNDPHPVSEQCMGPWMQDDIDFLVDLAEDYSYYTLQTISYERAMEGAMRSVDLVYNSDFQCQYEEIMLNIIYSGFDQYDFNLAEFILKTSQNLMANPFAMGMKLYDIYDIAFNTQQECLTDQEYIDTVGQMMDDFGSITSTILGLDLDWQKAEVYQAYSFDSDISTVSRDALTPKEFMKKYLH